jgi:hypothetical protein
MSFKASCVRICFTCSHHLSAESTYDEANSLLIDYSVIFYLSLNHCSYPLEHIKSVLIFHGHFISQHFNFWPSTAVLYFLTWQSSPTAYFLYCFTLPHESWWVFKHHPLPKPVVQYNPGFFNTSTEWQVRFFRPGFFHFQFFHFCPLLSCAFSSPFVVLPEFFLCFMCTSNKGN